ncbi:hypothetical protein PUN28_013207 [Cardiocondyla obscurior]|uniref:Uncharacterized protein n=1 Tax=Cardiocondyla obscurior TaxID=286306 RepID=A0AAW2F7H9_9HYME
MESQFRVYSRANKPRCRNQRFANILRISRTILFFYLRPTKSQTVRFEYEQPP